MNIQLKCQIYLIALIALTISSVSIAVEVALAPDGAQAGVEMKRLSGGGAAPLQTLVAADAPDASDASKTGVPAGDPGTSANPLTSAVGDRPADLPPPPSSPSSAHKGGSEDTAAVGEAKRTPSPLPPPAAAALKTSGSTDLAGGASPGTGRPATGAEPLASPQLGEISLSASIILSAQPVTVPLVPVKEDVTIDSKATPLGVEVRSVRGKLPYLTTQSFQATGGKADFSKLPVHRLLNLQGPYPIVDLTLLAALVQVANHKINLNSPGRSALGVRPDEKIQIRHLFHGVVGTSEDAIIAALLFSTEKGDALEDLRYFVRRGYLSFETSGTDKDKMPRYSIEGRRKFLGGILGPDNFATAVVGGRTIYIPVHNIKTGQTEIASNSAIYPTFSKVSIPAVLEAATASPDMFSPQHLPLGRDDGPFQDGTQALDSAYLVCRKVMAGTQVSHYQIISLGSESQEVGLVTNTQEFLRWTRQSAAQSQASKFSVDIEDVRSPVTSFASFQFNEGHLGRPDDFSPAHVKAWVNIGLQPMRCDLFRRVVEQWGFQMPDSPNDISLIQSEIINFVLHDLQSPLYKELPLGEQAWLKRSFVADARTLAFDTYAKLSFKRKKLSSDQRNILLNAVAVDLTREPERAKWHSAWSTKDIPLNDGIHKGYEFAIQVQKLPRLALVDLVSMTKQNINELLKSFMTIYNSNTALFGSKIGIFTPMLSRIFWLHVLPCDEEPDPAALRIFQEKCKGVAYDNLSFPKSMTNSREYQGAEELGKMLDDIYGATTVALSVVTK